MLNADTDDSLLPRILAATKLQNIWRPFLHVN